jgi:N-acetylneuraminate synthase
MKFGLKIHHSDFSSLIDMAPEALEFALFYGDMDGSWVKSVEFDGPIVLHMPEKFADGSLVDLASPEAGKRSAAVDILKRTIDLARAMLAESVVCHPGGIRATPEFVDPGPLLDSMRELIAYNRGTTQLLLENMPDIYWYKGVPHSSCLFKRKDEIVAILDELNIGLCMDLCHAKLYCNAMGEDYPLYVKSLKPYIRHVHVSDARGSSMEGVQIGEGEIDFASLAEALADVEAAAVPEILDGHKDCGAGFRVAVERLRNIGFFNGDGRR